MTRVPTSAARSSRGPNLAAFLVTATVVTYVYLNADPVISGTEPQCSAATPVGPPQISLPPAPPSAEPVEGESSATEVAAAIAGESASPAAPADPHGGLEAVPRTWGRRTGDAGEWAAVGADPGRG